MKSAFGYTSLTRSLFILCLIGLLSHGLNPSVLAADPFKFVDRTKALGIEHTNVCGAPEGQKGYLTEAMGAGAGWFDFNQDGRLDLYLVNGSRHGLGPQEGEPNQLYQQLEDGTFKDVTTASNTGDRGWGHGVTIGDYDQDGDQDLYITNFGKDVLLQNQGNGRFKDVTSSAGLGLDGWSSAAAWFDMEGDGDLDLYVARYVDFDLSSTPRGGSEAAKNNSNCTVHGVPVFCGPMGLTPQQDELYENLGNGKFKPVGKARGLYLSKPRYALGIVAADFDTDGDTDLYIANDSVANSLFKNDGTGHFKEVGLMTLSAFSGTGKPQAGMGVAIGDPNQDQKPDIVVTNFSHDLNTLYLNEGKFFKDASTKHGLGATKIALSWGVGLHDFDCDGDEDLFIANGHLYPIMDQYDNGIDYRQQNHLFEWQDHQWKLVSESAGPGLQLSRSWRGAAFADYDRDGDLDILVTSLGESPALLENQTPRKGSWLIVELSDPKHRALFGSVVWLKTPTKTLRRDLAGGGSYLSSSEPILHFGLAPQNQVSTIEIQWPDGSIERFKPVNANQRLKLKRGSGIIVKAAKPTLPSSPNKAPKLATENKG